MTSRPITKDEHIMIMKTMNENHEGFFKRNPQIIHILTVECSTGLRLGDILRMKLSDIYRTDNICWKGCIKYGAPQSLYFSAD